MSEYRREDWRGLKAHPAANLLPMMTEEEQEGLRTLLRQGYQRNEPIVLHQSQIVDGRNRLAQCIILDAAGELPEPPWFEDYYGDPEGIGRFVLDRSVKVWRELNMLQKSIVRLQMNPWLREELREAQHAEIKKGGPGRGNKKRAPLEEAHVFCDTPEPEKRRRERVYAERIGKEVGCNHATVERAAFLLDHRPDLAAAVVAGTIPGTHALHEAGWKDEHNIPAQAKKEKPMAKTPGAARKLRTQDLEALEAQIDGNVELFLEVASALRQIEKRKLFLDGYGEFHRYLHERWNIPFARITALIQEIDWATTPQEAKENG